MKYKEFKNIEKTLKKIVNFKEIGNLKHDKFIRILEQDKKKLKNNFKLILSRGIDKMLVRDINDSKIVNKLIKKYLIYAK